MLILIVPAFPDLHWHRRHGISRAPPAAPRVFTEKFIAALASRGWSHFEREAVSLMVLVPVVFSARVLSAANRRKVCRSASCALSYADQPWCGWRLASPSRERVDSRSESPKRIPPAELCRRLTPERSPVSYKRMNRVDGTKQRLLEAGRRLFADQGFDGASVRAITRRARANLGAVTYHFGSKQALYTAVLEQLFGELRERVTAATAAPAEARDRLGAIIRAFFAFFADHPEAPRLIIQRLAAGEPPPRAVVRHFRPVLDAIRSTVQDGQARGELRAMEPLLAAFTLISQTVWFAVARGMIATVSGVPLDRPDMAAIVERHITEVVHRALAPRKGGR